MKPTLASLLMVVTLFQCTSKQPTFEAPLLENLGHYNIPITTSSPYASRFFNQGLILANAFNHLEAARSFREAIRLDSSCAMAHWGLAYVLGPNYNTDGNLGDTKEIRNAVVNAQKYSENAQPWEKALIAAIAAKFPSDSEAANEEMYYKKMEKAYEAHKNNDLVVTLYAESIMNQHAWDLFTRKGGTARPWTPQIIALLEHALKINPVNPLANHLYIHAMEASPEVEKALESAKKLKTLVPGAGHLVHMPSHIYINTGDYHEGSLANEKAVIADSIYIATCQAEGVYPQMYYPHNYHFLAATAAFEGRAKRSIEATFKMADIIKKVYLRKPGFETTQHFITTPYNTLVKFAQWQKILALPSPADDLFYPRAIWHYARGMAYANTGKLQQAKKELEAVKLLAKKEEIQNMKIFEINHATDVVKISAEVLEGEMNRTTQNYEEAEQHFLAAIDIEDNLNYNEPPDWFFSVRHLLGDLYLRMGEYVKAEQVYREDLTYWVKNGYALNGLYHSLRYQEKHDEAAQVKKKFEEAWMYSEVQLKYSRVDENNIPEIELAFKDDMPEDLVYIAGSFCGFK